VNFQRHGEEVKSLLHIQQIPRVLFGDPNCLMQTPNIFLTYSPSNKRASKIYLKASHHVWYNASLVNGVHAFGPLHQDLILISILPTCPSYEFICKDHAIGGKFTIFEALCNCHCNEACSLDYLQSR
jgi:hypothetical protein